VRGVPVQRLREDDLVDGEKGRLYLSGLGIISIELLSLMLPTAASVRHLGVRSNRIRAEGATKLAAILNETKITTLDLRQNDLGPEGGAALAEGLKGNSTLQSLNLAGNTLCGLDYVGRGAYKVQAITKLCEALKGSAVTSLECAAAQECSLPCERR